MANRKIKWCRQYLLKSFVYTGGFKGNRIFGFTAYGISGLRLDSNQSKLYLLRHLQYPHFYYFHHIDINGIFILKVES